MKEDDLRPVEMTSVSARKYRPGRFCEVLSQEHVLKTLQNAILQGRLSHAYLFTGPRGVGKTTVARILAKAVNCEMREGAEPCDECSMCEEIRRGHAMDVIEIDGASNRRIGDVRELRQKVSLAPSRANKKVYIIDEVHMLTNEAFNALLKTLEEPPENVIFVFATTEPHKVPLTIVSRCQRFDFRRITRGETALYLKKVTKSENMELSDETIYAIARKADGSLRDALSLFDQIRAFTGGKFDEKDVREVTGMVEDEVFMNLFGMISGARGDGIIRLVNEITNSGVDLGEFYDGLLEHLRNLLVLKVDDSLAEVCEIPESIREKYLKLAPSFSTVELHSMFDFLSKNRILFRNSNVKKIILETSLLRFLPSGKETGGESVNSAIDHSEEASCGENRIILKQSKPDEGEQDVWKRFMDIISRRKATLFGLLSGAQPVALEGDTFILKVECQNSFMKDQLKIPQHISLMNDCMSEVCGRRVHFDIQFEIPHPAIGRKKGHSKQAHIYDKLKRILDAEEVK